MIKLHKLNGSELILNSELIECLEPGPQTTVILATGNRYLVTESADEISRRVLEYRGQVAAQAAALGKTVNPIQGFKREGL